MRVLTFTGYLESDVKDIMSDYNKDHMLWFLVSLINLGLVKGPIADRIHSSYAKRKQNKSFFLRR
jgi:hypothetical protein